VVNAARLSAQTSSSQNYNPSYGQLTWLNGKSNYMTAGSEMVSQGSLVPTAPADMYFAWGRHHQKIYVVPSLDLVVVRFGATTTDAVDQPGFDAELWTKIMAVVTN
jgi:CubicO group peptidase (beta-lactamase class C family)